MRIACRGMYDDIVSRRAQRFQDALNRIDFGFESDIVTMARAEYSANPRDQTISVAGEQIQAATNPVIRFVLEAFHSIRRCKESHLAGLQFQKINLQRLLRI